MCARFAQRTLLPMTQLFSLEAHQTLKLKNSKKISLVCSSGTVWITNPGDQKDYIIRTGERLELKVHSRRAPVIVGSFETQAQLAVISA